MQIVKHFINNSKQLKNNQEYELNDSVNSKFGKIDLT